MSESQATDAEMEEFFQQSAAPVRVDTSRLDEMVRDLQAKWDLYEERKKAAAEALKAYEILEKDVIATLTAVGKSKYFVDGLGTASIVTKLSYETPKSINEKNLLREYIVKEYGQDVADGMFSINSQTLNAWAKKENEAKPGIVIPGLASPTERKGLQFRPARK